MIKAYRTDVQDSQVAGNIINNLLREYPDNRVTFDLEDCDHVLRIEGNEFETERVIDVVGRFGASCEELL